MRIGIVDLDTSHPQNWIPIERELGHEIVGVWDGGSVHPPKYVADFAAERNLSRVYASLAEMVPDVDCAILHGCDWDTRVEKARPFVEAGKSVLIDKPMAGNLRDLNQLQAWVKAGARITGGSSLRYCREVNEWLARPVAERGAPHTVFCGCTVDEFNYGIHAYSMLCAILGAGLAKVRHLSQGVQRRIEATWKDGRVGFLTIGNAAGYLPFYATLVTEKSVTHLVADNNRLYRGLLEDTLPYLAEEKPEPLVPFDALIEAELCALAARASWLNGDKTVALDALKESDSGYDGATFAVGYRKMRYPEAK